MLNERLRRDIRLFSKLFGSELSYAGDEPEHIEYLIERNMGLLLDFLNCRLGQETYQSAYHYNAKCRETPDAADDGLVMTVEPVECSRGWLPSCRSCVWLKPGKAMRAFSDRVREYLAPDQAGLSLPPALGL